jgi:hypothetical protein
VPTAPPQVRTALRAFTHPLPEALSARSLLRLGALQEYGDDAAGLIGSHDLAHDRDPGGTGVEARPDAIGCHTAERDDGNPEVRCAPYRRDAQRRAAETAAPFLPLAS